MAVRKQTGKRLQRVRAFPNFIDWSWRTPVELTQKLGRFEKSLRGMFGDLGDLLLKVVDGNRSPDYTHEGVDTVRFVGSGVSLAKTREGYVTVTITDTNVALGGTPSSVGTSNVEGSGPEAAYYDHEHDHGAQSTSNHHALAAGSSLNGFLVTTTGATTGNPVVKQADGTHAWDDTLLAMVYIGGTGTLSVEAGGVLDFDAGTSVDMDAVVDVFIDAGDDIVATAANDFVAEATNGTMVVRSPGAGQQTQISAAAEVDISAPTVDINATGSPGIVDIDAAVDVDINAAVDVNIDAVDDIKITATDVMLVQSSAGQVLVRAIGTAQNVNVTATADFDVDVSDDVILDAGDVISATAVNDFDIFAARLDMNSNPIEAVDHVRFINTRTAETDAASTSDAFSVYNGVPHAVRSSTYNYVVDHPVHVQYGNATEGATISVNIDTTSIAGKDLSNGVVEFQSRMYFQQAGVGDDAYTECCRYAYYRAKDTVTGNISNGSSSYGEREANWSFGSFAHPNVLTVSGTNNEIVTFQLQLPGGSGTGRLLWIIQATGLGG